jgi:hypothetical protein
MLGVVDDLIVEAIGKCESDDLNPKLAFQGLLAAINFVMRSSGGVFRNPDSVIFHRLCFPISASKRLGRTGPRTVNLDLSGLFKHSPSCSAI